MNTSDIRIAAVAFIDNEADTLIADGYATRAQVAAMRDEAATGEPIVQVSTKCLNSSGSRVNVAAWAGIRSHRWGLHPIAADPVSQSMNRPRWAATTGGMAKLAAWWAGKHYPGVPHEHRHHT